MINRLFKFLLYSFLFCSFFSLVFLVFFPFLQSIRISFGVFFVLFLPGYIWSYVFSDDNSKRLLLGIILSLIFVPLGMFYANMAGLKITTLNISFLVLFFCISGLITLFCTKKKK